MSVNNAEKPVNKSDWRTQKMVSFRLDEKEHAVFVGIAKKNGLSPGHFARRLVRDAIALSGGE